MSSILSGRSHSNGIMFKAFNYSASFTSKPHQLEITYLKRREGVAFMKETPDRRTLTYFILDLFFDNVSLFLLMWSIIDIYRLRFSLSWNPFQLGSLIWWFMHLSLMGIYFSFLKSQRGKKSGQAMYQYHGAEHKTIWAVEKGLPLTVESVKACPRLHPRCGTNLVTYFWLLSVPLTLLSPLHSVAIFLAYVFGKEYFYAIEKHPRSSFLLKCGFWVQEKITTLEPETDQLEEAIFTMKELLSKEQLLQSSVKKYLALKKETYDKAELDQLVKQQFSMTEQLALEDFGRKVQRLEIFKKSQIR